MDVSVVRRGLKPLWIVVLAGAILVALLSLIWVQSIEGAGLPAYSPLLPFALLPVAVAIIRWPRLGMFLSLMTAPVEVGLVYVAGFGMYAFQPIVMLTATGLAIRSILGRGKFLVPRRMWPIIGLWLTYVLSAFFAIDMETTLGGIVYFIPLLVLCWVFAKEIRSDVDLERIVAGMIWIGFTLALVGLIQLGAYYLGHMITFGPRHANFLLLYGRPSGLQGEPDWFGIYVGMILAMAMPLWIRKEMLFRNRLATLLVLIMGVAILVSGTRSAWMGLLVAGGLYFWIARMQLARKTVAALGLAVLLATVLLVLIMAAPQILEPLNRLKYLFDPSEYNSAVRLNTWAQAFEYIRRRPIVGYGLSAWELLSPQVWEDRRIAVITGKSVPNIFLENWLSAGLPGLLLTVVFCSYYTYHLWRSLRRSRDHHERAYLESVLMGFVMVSAASFFTNAFKHNWYWVMVALIIAALNVRKANRRTLMGGA
jgi:O-antigen ligase